MKTNQNLRRLGEKKGSNNKISHAEFISASSTRAVIVNDHNMRGRFRSARRTPGKFGMTIDNNHAFTLIELLVVVLIIGILAAVALPKYEAAVVRSRVGAMLPLMASLSQAQEVYYLENNQYASDVNELDVDVAGGGCTPILHDAETPGSSFACGTYSTLTVYNLGSVNLNYCPDHNQSIADCEDNRTVHITFRPKHMWFAEGAHQASKRYCLVYHDSKLAKAVCASLGLLTDTSQ